jgi:hypothetical protein
MNHIRGGGCAIRGGGGAFGYDNDGVEAAVGDAGELFFTVPKLSGGMGIGSGMGGGARESYHDDYEDDEHVGFGGGSCGTRPYADDDDDDDNLFGG